MINGKTIQSNTKSVPTSRRDLSIADEIEQAVREVTLELENIQSRLSDISEHITATSHSDLLVYAEVSLNPNIKGGFLEFAKKIRETVGLVAEKVKFIKEKLKEYGMIEQTVTLISVLSNHFEIIFLYFKDLIKLINRINKEQGFLTKFKIITDRINKEIFEFNTKTLNFALLGFLKTHVRGDL